MEQKKRNQPKPDGICRNDRIIQISCTTARKVAQKVKGKPTDPSQPTMEQWQ